jgi:hypothetical protein
MFRGTRPRAARIVVTILVGGWAGAACGDVTNEALPDPAAAVDEAVFRCKVEPILIRQCSFNACHGNAGSPLRVFSPGKLRGTPPHNIDEAIAALTDAEHHANFLSAAGFGVGVTAVDDNDLLRKPLPAVWGGYAHKGGAIYDDPQDPQYTTIRAWLTKSSVCP